MTDYEFTDKLAITLIVWDRDRRDEVSVTMHAVFIDGKPTLQTYSVHLDRDKPGMEVTELPLIPEEVDRLITGLRAHQYAERRKTVRPRPRDHAERKGRRPGPCIECLATGWVVTPRIRRPDPNRPDRWLPVTYGWRPCPRCESGTGADEAALAA